MSAWTGRLQQALDAQGARACVMDMKALHGGACQDNVRVDLELGGAPVRMVLRSDAATSLPGSIGRGDEYDVITAAVAQGVPTPAARWPSTGVLRPGARAYLLDWVDGEAIGRRILRSPELAHARTLLPVQLASALAAIHRVTPSSLPSLEAALAGRSPVEVALSTLRSWRDRLPEVHPAVELALRWLEDHVPVTTRITLVHGDFRVGNFMVKPDGLSAVLDWEFAHAGDPLEDLAWLCVRDWRFGNNALAAGGLCTRGVFVDAYERASGVRVDTAAMHWWEVFGNVRWALGSVFQAERYLGGEERELELLAIGRRAVEMEWEALRLMRRGPRPATERQA